MSSSRYRPPPERAIDHVSAVVKPRASVASAKTRSGLLGLRTFTISISGESAASRPPAFTQETPPKGGVSIAGAGFEPATFGL